MSDALCKLVVQTLVSDQLMHSYTKPTLLPNHVVHPTTTNNNTPTNTKARKVRTALEDHTQSREELRRSSPYGYQFLFDWLTRLEVLRGAAAGLEYMHTHGVIHRDLTSYNLLLDFGKPWQVQRGEREGWLNTLQSLVCCIVW